MKPSFMAMRNVSDSIIAGELLRSPYAIMATINTLVSSSTAIKERTTFPSFQFKKANAILKMYVLTDRKSVV